MAKASRDYEQSVFINCPYDKGYLDILHAITFTIRLAGFIPRCALEEDDSGTVRLERIFRIIEECRYGIHDISCMDPAEPSGLPRLNMAFETGLFFGARRFGAGHHGRKRLLVLEGERYQTQRILSDIAGNDPKAHHRQAELAIAPVLSFLFDPRKGTPPPGSEYVQTLYAEFKSDLPALAEELRHSQIGIMQLEQWKLFVVVVEKFLAKRLPPAPRG